MRTSAVWFISVIGVVLSPRNPVSAELRPFGVLNDDQTSILYDPSSGEIYLDTPLGTDSMQFLIESESGIFVHHESCKVPRSVWWECTATILGNYGFDFNGSMSASSGHQAVGGIVSEVRFIGIYNQEVGAAIISTNRDQESVTLKEVALEPGVGDRLAPGESITFTATGLLDGEQVTASATATLPRLPGSVFDWRGQVQETASIDIPTVGFQPRVKTLEVDLISGGDRWDVSVVRFQFLAVPEPTTFTLASIAFVLGFAISSVRQRKV